VDAGGLSGPSILAASGPNEGWLIEQAAGVIPNPIGSSAIELFGSPATDYTLMFRKHGWLGFDFNLSWKKNIHSRLDNLDNLNPDSIQHQGEHMLALVRHFGNISLAAIPQKPRPIYFDILGLSMLYYPASWALPILLGVTLVFIAALLQGSQHKWLTRQGIGLGALAFLLSLLTIPVLLILVQLVIIQPLLAVNMQLSRSLVGDSLLSNSIRWGSAFLTLMTTFLWYTLFRRTKRVDTYDLAFGAYLLIYACACGTTLAVPALSYLLVWPLLAGLIAILFRFSSGKEKPGQMSQPQFFGLLGAGVVAIMLFVPGIIIALFSIDIQMIPLVPVFVVVLLGFLIPDLEIFLEKK